MSTLLAYYLPHFLFYVPLLPLACLLVVNRNIIYSKVFIYFIHIAIISSHKIEGATMHATQGQLRDRNFNTNKNNISANKRMLAPRHYDCNAFKETSCHHRLVTCAVGEVPAACTALSKHKQSMRSPHLKLQIMRNT